MHDRKEWQQGTTGVHKVGKRTYNNLVEFSRPCNHCGERFSIYVTPKIASGVADSNSFGLKNCELHRRNKSAATAEVSESLVMVNKTMKAELDGLYARDASLFTENQALKARLAKYELQGVMENEATTNSALRPKMPWE